MSSFTVTTTGRARACWRSSNGDTDKKGLALVICDSGNSDALALGTANKKPRACSPLSVTVSLGGNIVGNTWYRLTMDVVVTGASVTVTGTVFRAHDADGRRQRAGNSGRDDAELSPGARPVAWTRRARSAWRPSAFGAMADSSVANFTIHP